MVTANQDLLKLVPDDATSETLSALEERIALLKKNREQSTTITFLRKIGEAGEALGLTVGEQNRILAQSLLAPLAHYFDSDMTAIIDDKGGKRNKGYCINPGCKNAAQGGNHGTWCPQHEESGKKKFLQLSIEKQKEQRQKAKDLFVADHPSAS